MFNGAVSGVGSILGGGNFWMGAGQGLIVTAFNYLGHRIDNYKRDLTKEFNEQLKRTKDFFTSRKRYYDNKMKALADKGARPEVYMAIAQDQIMEFYRLVKTGSPYDIKNDPKSLFSNAQLGKDVAIYNGEVFRVDDFGNYNFGVAAKAYGYSLDFSQKGAGLYQIYSGTSNIGWISSYFDDPRDYTMIAKGYRHFK